MVHLLSRDPYINNEQTEHCKPKTNLYKRLLRQGREEKKVKTKWYIILMQSISNFVVRCTAHDTKLCDVQHGGSCPSASSLVMGAIQTKCLSS